MGEPMALNVLKAGHRLTVYDRRPDATAELERRGATRAADLVALGREVRATLLSLPDERVVETVVFGDRPGTGLVDGTQPGDVIIDLSTVSPGSTRRLATRTAGRGVTLIDAPVSGSVGGARAGTLAVMIGASEETAGPFAPVLGAIGSSLFYLGETGRGNVLKLLNNLTALTNQAVLCQAMALADRLGVPRQVVGDVLGKSSGASFILERKLPAITRHDYAAGFFVDLALKDLRLALELAREAGARLEVADAAQRLYDEASGKGLGRLDSCGLLALLEPSPHA
jgi:3-hydroxyisobutyrate dehydrogenase-like beta-hydroxyacid dehydrogenase